MKQKVSSIQTSSIPTGAYGNFDTPNNSICDMEDPDFLAKFSFKVLGHLNHLLENQMR